MSDLRSKALEELVNIKPTKLKLGAYRVLNLYYIVKPYSEIKRQGKQGGNITKYIYVTYTGIKFGIWELTPAMVKKLGIDRIAGGML